MRLQDFYNEMLAANPIPRPSRHLYGEHPNELEKGS